MGKNVVVLGTQWGDEGKGKIVDLLTDQAAAVVRYQGGRYDGIGEHFGRARPATGFSCDLYALGATQFVEIETIVAPKGNHQDLLNAIADARTQGLRVVQLLGHDDLSSVPYATHQMVLQNGQWIIEKI